MTVGAPGSHETAKSCGGDPLADARLEIERSALTGNARAIVDNTALNA